MTNVDIICPVLEQERHLVGMVHEMRNVEISDVDLWHIEPLTDQCRMSPAVGHILAEKWYGSVVPRRLNAAMLTIAG